ncbi:MAG: hypothetical protein AAF569_05045 [Pseudomonadota bacterium]
MDEVAKRLKDTSETCIGAYDAWRKSEKDASAREALQEAVHELRKVASRIEIEMAVSERDNSSAGRVAIPEHKSRNKKPQGASNDANGNQGNDDGEAPRANIQRRSRNRRPNKSAEG